LFADRQWLSQCQVFGAQVDLGNKRRSENQHTRFQEAHLLVLGRRGNPKFQFDGRRQGK